MDTKRKLEPEDDMLVRLPRRRLPMWLTVLKLLFAMWAGPFRGRGRRRYLIIFLAAALAVPASYAWLNWRDRNDFTLVPGAASVRDATPELAGLERAGFVLTEQGGEDPEGGSFTDFSIATWRRSDDGASLQIRYTLHTSGGSKRRGTYLNSPTENAARGVQEALRRTGLDDYGYETTGISGLGDEAFEQFLARTSFPSESRDVLVVVRAQNVVIRVWYVNQANGVAELEEMRPVARGVAAAAVERLQAVNAG